MKHFLFLLSFIFVVSSAQAEEDPWYKTAPSCVIDRGNPARTNEYNVAPLTQLHGHVTSNEKLENNSIWTLSCGDGLWYVGQFTALPADLKKINDPPVWQHVMQETSYDIEQEQGPIFYKGILYYSVLSLGRETPDTSRLIGLNGKTGKQVSELTIHKAVNYFFIYNDIVYFSLVGEITAYSLKTGKEIWSVPMPPARRYDNDPGPLATNGLLLYGGKNDLYAIDLKTGKIIWKNKHTSGYHFKIYKDKIIAAGNINVIALNSITGKNVKQYSESLGLIAVTDGMILGYDGTNIIALDLNTGEKIWEIPGRIFYDTGAIAGNVLYFLDYDYKLHAVNKFTGKELWSYQLIDDDPNRASAPRTLSILPINKGLLVGDPNGHLQILY